MSLSIWRAICIVCDKQVLNIFWSVYRKLSHVYECRTCKNIVWLKSALLSFVWICVWFFSWLLIFICNLESNVILVETKVSRPGECACLRGKLFLYVQFLSMLCGVYFFPPSFLSLFSLCPGLVLIIYVLFIRTNTPISLINWSVSLFWL